MALGQNTPHTSIKTWPAVNTETMHKIAEKVGLNKSFKNSEIAPPISWISEISGKTVSSENITTAHQQLVNERDKHTSRYNTQVEAAVNSLLSYYHTVSSQEKNWIERWKSQIEMLKREAVH